MEHSILEQMPNPGCCLWLEYWKLWLPFSAHVVLVLLHLNQDIIRLPFFGSVEGFSFKPIGIILSWSDVKEMYRFHLHPTYWEYQYFYYCTVFFLHWIITACCPEAEPLFIWWIVSLAQISAALQFFTYFFCCSDFILLLLINCVTVFRAVASITHNPSWDK